MVTTRQAYGKAGEGKGFLKDLKQLTITSEHKWTLDVLSGQFSGPQVTMGSFPSQKEQEKVLF